MKMNIWYVFVGIVFIVAGIYRIVSGHIIPGLIWIVIGILFGVLARFSNKEESSKGKKSNKKK